MKAMAAMKAMKGMKAMAAMKGMKAMKAMKAKKKSEIGKKSPWIAAVTKARAALKIKGFSPIKKGTPLYNKAKEFYGKLSKSPMKSPKKFMELNSFPEIMSYTTMAMVGIFVASGAVLVAIRRRTSKAGKDALLSFQF